MQSKIKWIENLKGLTMFFVVLGHIATPLTNFIFSWHMPVFFFISGFFISAERTIKESVKKETRRLILPFFIFGSLGLVAEIIKRNLFQGFDFAIQDFVLLKEIEGLFLWMDFTHMHQYGFVLWFLVALFWGKLILQYLLGIIENKVAIGIICLLLFFVFANRNFVLPFSVDKSLFSLIWLFGGYFCYNYCIKEKLKSEVYLIVVAIIVLIILPIPLINASIKVAINPLASILYSFSIITLLIAIFRNFGERYLNNSFLENWGKNSLAILVIHPYTNNVGYIIGNKFFSGNWGVNFIISVIMLTMSLLAIKYVDKKIKNSSFAYRFQSARIN